jgi:hypothetical protein
LLRGFADQTHATFSDPAALAHRLESLGKAYAHGQADAVNLVARAAKGIIVAEGSDFSMRGRSGKKLKLGASYTPVKSSASGHASTTIRATPRSVAPDREGRQGERRKRAVGRRRCS